MHNFQIQFVYYIMSKIQPSGILAHPLGNQQKSHAINQGRILAKVNDYFRVLQETTPHLKNMSLMIIISD